MPEGSCLCGAVAYAADDAGPMWHCHCERCRKTSGAAFATWLRAASAGFRWTRGEAGISRFESSPGVHRAFCTRCSSPLPRPAREAGAVVLPAGALSDASGAVPAAHDFVASKAPWYEIPDALPRLDGSPPEGAPPAPPLARPPRGEGVLGSCLCGSVRWEVLGELALIYTCHCSRCRAHSGSAHDTCLVVTPEAIRWHAGAENTTRFHLPNTERWTCHFCDTCGAPTPPPEGPGCIPAGGLDGDPGARIRFHIFCGSKAPWFEIADDLLAFDERPG